jgi:hypothetical protein
LGFGAPGAARDVPGEFFGGVPGRVSGRVSGEVEAGSVGPVRGDGDAVQVECPPVFVDAVVVKRA